MHIYCVRHGDYVQGDSDGERCLSKKGEEETSRIAGYLKQHNVTPKFIWHSNMLRACQTATIIASNFAAAQVVERSDMTPLDHTEGLAEEINKLNVDIILVGHLPFLPKLASVLLYDAENKNSFCMKPSSVLCLEREEAWQVDWLIWPEMI